MLVRFHSARGSSISIPPSSDRRFHHRRNPTRSRQNSSSRRVPMLRDPTDTPLPDTQFREDRNSSDAGKKTINLPPVALAGHRRTWIFLLIVFLHLIILLAIRSLPISARWIRLPSPNGADPHPSCDSGMVFVYDLPPFFNRELFDDCESLLPFYSLCDALSNEGFGLHAADLVGIVPEKLLPAWYSTDQFSAEIIYHNRMLGHRCRTLDPDSATAFYVPFYAGLAVGKFLWPNYDDSDRDRHCKMLLEWLQRQRFWERSGGGWDHFLTMGRITWDFRRSPDKKWGSSFLYMPGMKNVTRLLIERDTWDEFDIGVPYPTGFHPRTSEDVREWQEHVLNRKRSTRFCFAGARRAEFKDDFRALLMDQCRDSGGACRSLDCSLHHCLNSSRTTMELFLDSEFCLQPRGDSFTRRSTFDCMLAGSIPVFFWRRTAYLQYPWHLPAEPESYSVFIDRRDVKNGSSIRAVLEGLGEERVRRMREKIVEYLPRLVYASPRGGLEGTPDAFDVAVEVILKRFQQQKQQRLNHSSPSESG